MSTTRVSRLIAAPPPVVYRALIDPAAVQTWRVPLGMTSRVERFDPRQGGELRVTLTYDDPRREGKSGPASDTVRGSFLALEPCERVVEALEFETGDPRLEGTMTVTTTLQEAGAGTLVTLLHEGIPPGVAPADNEIGTRMALDRLAELLEGD